MMLCSDDKIFHPRFYRIENPFLSIKLYRIKFMCDVEIVFAGYFFFAHQVLGITIYFMTFPFSTRQGINTPVNKHSKPCFTPPFYSLVVCFHRCSPPPVYGFINCFLVTVLPAVEHFLVLISRRLGNRLKG